MQKNDTNDINVSFIKIIRELVESETTKLSKAIKKYQQDKLCYPVLQTVQFLPKDELAELAESLVSLTSLKRKVTNTLETVGGPTDVAVISKGDGLVWVKRKHYFSSELNPQFIARYNREVI